MGLYDLVHIEPAIVDDGGVFHQGGRPGDGFAVKVQAFIHKYDAIGLEESFHHPGVVCPACAWDFRHAYFVFVEEAPFIDGGPNARMMVKELCVVLEFERPAYGFDPMEVVCWLDFLLRRIGVKHAPICPLDNVGEIVGFRRVVERFVHVGFNVVVGFDDSDIGAFCHGESSIYRCAVSRIFLVNDFEAGILVGKCVHDGRGVVG